MYTVLLVILATVPSIDDAAVATRLDACAAGEGLACAELAARWDEAGRSDRAAGLWLAGCVAGDEAACTRCGLLLGGELPEEAGGDRRRASDDRKAAWQRLSEACRESGGPACRLLASSGARSEPAAVWLGLGCRLGDGASCERMETLGLGRKDLALSGVWAQGERGKLRFGGERSLHIDLAGPVARSPGLPTEIIRHDQLCLRASAGTQRAITYGDDRCRQGGTLWLGDARTLETAASWPYNGGVDMHILFAREGDVILLAQGTFIRFRVGEAAEEIETPQLYEAGKLDLSGRWLVGVSDGDEGPRQAVLHDLDGGGEVPLDLVLAEVPEDVHAMRGSPHRGESLSAVAAGPGGRLFVATTTRLTVHDTRTGKQVMAELPLGTIASRLLVSEDGRWLAWSDGRYVTLVRVGKLRRKDRGPWTLDAVAPVAAVDGGVAPGQRHLGGRVVASGDGLPAGAEVVFIGTGGGVASAEVDAGSGRFSIPMESEWHGGIQARAPGWISETLAHDRQSDLAADLRLIPARTVTLQIRDPEGRPVPDARWIALTPGRRGWERYLAEGVAGEDSAAQVHVPVGAPAVVVLRGKGDLFAEVDLGSGEIGEPIAVSLKHAAEEKVHAIRFVDDMGQPVEGARPRDGRWQALCSGPDGWLVVPDDSRARQNSARGRPPYRLGHLALYNEDPGATHIPVGTSTLTIARPDLDDNVAGALPEKKLFRLPDHAWAGRLVQRGPELHYEGLTPGEWVALSVDWKQGRSAVDLLAIEPGTGSSLQPSWSDGVVGGRVFESDGWPAAHASVWSDCIQRIPEIKLVADFGLCQVRTDLAGRFELRGLSGGDRFVEAAMDDANAWDVRFVSHLDQEIVLRLDEPYDRRGLSPIRGHAEGGAWVVDEVVDTEWIGDALAPGDRLTRINSVELAELLMWSGGESQLPLIWYLADPAVVVVDGEERVLER